MATQTRPFLKVRLLLLVAIVFGLHTRADAIDSLEWGPLPIPIPLPIGAFNRLPRRAG